MALHFGTLVAVTFLYRKTLWEMVRDSALFVMRRPSVNHYKGARLMIWIGVATLPAVVVGLGFKKEIEELFVSPKITGVELIITGLLLWITRKIQKHTKTEQNMTLWVALLIGIAQAVAIRPGISRSGATIATALFLGFDQIFAAHFSFLMSIPAILGSVVLEGKQILLFSNHHILPVFLGTTAAAITGFLSIVWLIRMIGRGRLYLFSYYCWIVGILAVIFL